MDCGFSYGSWDEQKWQPGALDSHLTHYPVAKSKNIPYVQSEHSILLLSVLREQLLQFAIQREHFWHSPALFKLYCQWHWEWKKNRKNYISVDKMINVK